MQATSVLVTKLLSHHPLLSVTRPSQTMTDCTKLPTGKSFLQGEIICIRGLKDDRLEEFYVHKDLAVVHSRFFAVLGNFREGQENLVELKDVDLDGLELVILWMYDSRALSRLQKIDRIATLIGAYVTADMLVMEDCKNDVLDSIRRLHIGTWVNFRYLIQVDLAGLQPSSCVARYLIDQICYDTVTEGKHWFPDTDEDLSEFLLRGGLFVLEVFSAVTTARGKCQHKPDTPDPVCIHRDPAKLKGCHYHEHSEDKTCGEAQNDTM